MRWFPGSIAEAVKSSKARNAVFVVFVEGPDDASRSVLTAINTLEVSSKLESSDFVAIKLDSQTEPYRQFAEIYQVVPVPSLFFIGRDGQPLEVVSGTFSSTEIVKRIETILVRARGLAVGQLASVAPLPSGTGVTGPSTSAAEGTDEARMNLEEARALIERNRARKLEEDAANERERETERRKVGQDVQRLRQWQLDQEYKQLKEDRERERREEAAARERVKSQIAQDKEERTKRNTQAQEGRKEAQDAPRHVSNSDIARLQLRLPDGSVIHHQLASSATLGELRAFVSDYIEQTVSSFVLSTTFPRRVLTCSEDDQTMTQLELVPTAVILVLPASAGGITLAGPSALSVVAPVRNLFWVLFTPVFSIFTQVKNLMFGRSANQVTGGVSSNASSRRRLSPEPSAQGGPSRRMPATSSEVRRQGNSNIHRLAQPEDSSDEDNNTWNGNSTQQM